MLPNAFAHINASLCCSLNCFRFIALSNRIAEYSIWYLSSGICSGGQSPTIGLSSRTTEVNRASTSTSTSDLAVIVDSENLQEKSDVLTSLVTNYTYNSEGNKFLQFLFLYINHMLKA